MDTPEFSAALAELVAAARQRPTAVMCAESLWWQCHRRLIADSVVASGHAVLHIESDTKASPHRLISPARLVEGQLTYADEQSQLGLE